MSAYIDSTRDTNTYFTVYLSSEGDSIKITGFSPLSSTPLKTIPEQAEAAACASHESVLAFLRKLQSSDRKDSLAFYHSHNNFYPNHTTYPKGSTHPCSLDEQISFVTNKILEKERGIRQPQPIQKSWCVIL